MGRILAIVVGLVVFAHPSAAAPKTKSAPLTAELTKFADDMAKAFDQVYVLVAEATKLEGTGKFAEAVAKWRGVYEGGRMLAQQVERAGSAGAFRDPMTFGTKAGKLTAATYIAQVQKLIARGDVGWAKAADHDAQAKAKQAKLTYVAAIATQVMSLETIAKSAADAAKRQPESARVALENVARGAASLRTSVTNAAKQKRAAANATYPVKPKALTAVELAKHLTDLEKAARTALAALPKPQPKQVATAKPTTKPARGGGPDAAPNPKNATPTPEPEPAAVAVPACSPEGEIGCDNTNLHEPCCAGSRCLPAGWITNGTDAEGYPTVEPEYYACQDPDLAPKR